MELLSLANLFTKNQVLLETGNHYAYINVHIFTMNIACDIKLPSKGILSQLRATAGFPI